MTGGKIQIRKQHSWSDPMSKGPRSGHVIPVLGVKNVGKISLRTRKVGCFCVFPLTASKW